MASIQFRLSSKSDKSTGLSEVLVRFFHGKAIDQRAKTNIFVRPDYWNQKSQRLTIPRLRVMTLDAKALIQELADINSRLEALKEYINQKFINAGAGKVPVSSQWLSAIIEEYNFPKEERAPSVLETIPQYLDTHKLSKPRAAHYRVLRRALERFLIFSGIKTGLSLDEVSADMIRDFINYLKAEHTFYRIEEDKDGRRHVLYLNEKFKKAIQAVPESRLPEERGQNTINGFLNCFRTFYLWAVDQGFTTNNPFHKFGIPASVYGTPYYITVEERNQLFDYDFSFRPQLEKQRDIFVFQCVIGCRVSDLHSLTKSNVINGAIEYIPRKTKEGHPVTVRVPLNAIARKILDKYKDIPGERLLPCISDQKYNEAIKEMFTIAGLTRPVTILNPTTREEEKRPLNEVASSHLARRCFIGNLYKQVKDPNLIGKLSGHSEGSRAFARYRDIDEDMRKELVTMLE